MFVPKDLETIRNAFKALDKATWASVDGDQVVTLYKTFAELRQLEMKIEQALKPSPAPQAVALESSPPPAKKGKKNADT